MRKALLAQQGRREGMPDLRGFEWFHLWHLANSERLAFKGHRSTVGAVAVSPNGKVCATTSLAAEGRRGDRLFLWDLTTGKKRATLYSAVDLEALAFSSDGKFLVTAGDGNSLSLWDAEAGKDQYVIVEKPLRSLRDKALSGTILALASPRIELPINVREFKEIKKDANGLKKDTKEPDLKDPKAAKKEDKQDPKEPPPGKKLTDAEEKQLAEI